MLFQGFFQRRKGQQIFLFVFCRPDASSDFAGKRFTFVRDLMGYIDGVKGKGQVIREIQDIPFRERAGEYLMTRLRTVSGAASLSRRRHAGDDLCCMGKG